MKLHRFFGDFNFNSKRIEIFDKEILHQLKNVLRLENGDSIILCDGKLNEALARIENLNKNSALLEIEKIYKNENEPENYVSLYCAILKRENFELVIQKAVEIGIKEIIPVISERTIKLGFKIDRIEKIIKEAAEQSGRGELPIFRQSINFKDAVKNAKENDFNLFFDISGEKIGDRKIDKQNQQKENHKISVFIGPEGGWSENETEFVGKIQNFKIISLGNLTLRAETAAIIACYFTINKLVY